MVLYMHSMGFVLFAQFGNKVIEILNHPCFSLLSVQSVIKYTFSQITRSVRSNRAMKDFNHHNHEGNGEPGHTRLVHIVFGRTSLTTSKMRFRHDAGMRWNKLKLLHSFSGYRLHECRHVDLFRLRSMV